MRGRWNADRVGTRTADREPADAAALPGWVSAGATARFPCDVLVVRTAG